jgi:pimeloyl-ACP methyl ester carboxylesterase
MGAIGRVFDAHHVPFDAWVETGTLHGDGANWLADQLPQVPGVTIDCREYGYQRPGVRVVIGDSVDALPLVLNDLGGRVAFWLDAHYPDLYDRALVATALPLEAELRAIRRWANRPGNEAWVWADDMRVYGARCDSGPLPPEYTPAPALDLADFTWSHLITFDPRDEGYLILTPWRAA